jgi:hypothetical protein
MIFWQVSKHEGQQLSRQLHANAKLLLYAIFLRFEVRAVHSHTADTVFS